MNKKVNKETNINGTEAIIHTLEEEKCQTSEVIAPYHGAKEADS